MESRRLGLSVRTNQQENIALGKKIDALPKLPKARPALRDLSNKLGPQISKDVVQKKNIVASTKDNFSKLRIESVQAPNFKPLFKKQESILEKVYSYSSKQLMIYDPDESSKDDLAAVAEYVQEIFSYLRELEVKYTIRKDFLVDHRTTSFMRSTVVNWLVELQVSFKLTVETLYMCVSLMDRYLSLHEDVGKETLQLVGVASLMIASKFEEIYIPDIGDFVYVCDDSFSAREILAMEKDILASLGFHLTNPTAIQFLRRTSKIAKATSLHHCLAKYLLELALLDHQMCNYLPSCKAAAACCLAIGILNGEMDLSKIWSPTLVHYTTYKLSDIRPIMRKFAVLLDKEEKSKYRAVSQKYAEASNNKISTNPKLRCKLVMKLVSEVK